MFRCELCIYIQVTNRQRLSQSGWATRWIDLPFVPVVGMIINMEEYDEEGLAGQNCDLEIEGVTWRHASKSFRVRIPATIAGFDDMEEWEYVESEWNPAGVVARTLGPEWEFEPFREWMPGGVSYAMQ